MSRFAVRLRFHGDLSFFLRSKASAIQRQLSERTSVKDVIEACGVPHTEVDLILAEGQPVNFGHVIDAESTIDIFPFELGRITSFP